MSVAYSINYNTILFEKNSNKYIRKITDIVRCYILDIDILLTGLTNKFQNFKLKNKKTQEYYIKELYDDTDQLIAHFHNILDKYYKRQDVIEELIKMLNYIKRDYNDIVITFNNILENKENQENGFLLMLRFWANKRIYKHYQDIMSYNELLNN